PERCGVVAIPNQVFYDDKSAGATQVRWAFCKRTAVLEEAVDRLGRLAR
ncbi:aminotransferase, partial [Streptomyces sp. NPDC041003]